MSGAAASEWQQRGYIDCLIEKQFARSTEIRVVSFKQTPFPKLAPLCRRYRLLVDYTGEGRTIRIMIAKARTELGLVAAAPYAGRREVEAAELRLARMLVGRATA